MAMHKMLIYLAAIIAICVAADDNRNLICQTNDDCTKYHLLCLNGVCRCEKGKRISGWSSTPDNTGQATCELVFGGTCTGDDECKDLESSVCRDEKCICVERYFPGADDRQCLLTSGPRQPCNSTLQCTPIMSYYAECKQNVCLCKSGYYIGADEKCVKAKNLGETCTHNDECLIDANASIALHCKNGECSGANYNAAVSVATILLIVSGIFLQ